MKTGEYETISVEETLRSLDTGPDGLSTDEAAKRAAAFGRNEVVEKKPSAMLEILSRFWGPMPWLLELTMVLSYFLGHFLEAAVILLLLCVNAGIGYWNERNSRKALELLKRQLRVQTNVRRGGQWLKVPSADLAPGDVVGIGLGGLVPADLKLIDGEVNVDQAALTGESLPVSVKTSGLAYAGSLVKRGEARGVVLNIGASTYFGRTAELVRTAHAVSHQQQIMLKVIQYMLYVALAAVAVVALDALRVKTPPTTILTIALIYLMGAVPVALPAVFTVVLAVGALELSRRAVLVTRLSAIEDAASMSVLCLDKTGTITRNELAVVDPVPWKGARPEDVATAAGMASGRSQDLMDAAVRRYWRSTGAFRDHRELSFTPFDPALKRTEALVEDGGKRYRVVKGAAQVVASLCRELDDSGRQEIDRQVRELSLKGYRVLAVARSEGQDPEQMRFLGLLPLADPPRPDSQAMIEEMRRLGVRVKMLTGDNLAIAREIAQRVSLGERIIRMPEIVHLSEAEQAVALEKCDGVAEIYPEDKHRIVKLLQSRGYIVGMTGDGVNDAPALKQAEVGIAVESATDVAKAAASIVLTEPGLSAIAAAITTSRKIYQRMLSWVLNKVTKVVQFIGLLTAGFLLWRELLISPLDMVLLIFANDFVTMSLATDNATGTAAPNAWNVKNITLGALPLGLLLTLQGLITAAAARYWLHLPPPKSQTLVLLSLVFTSLFRILIIRERRHFWSSRPARALAITVCSTMAAFLVLGILGAIIPSVSAGQVVLIFLFSAVYVFLLDFPKYAVFRKLGL